MRLVYIIILLAICGCKTQERKKADAIKWIVENPTDMDRFKGLFYYDARPEISEGTFFVVKDTTRKDSVKCPDGTKLKCPDCEVKIRVDTFKTDKTKTIEAIQALQREVVRLDTNLSIEKENAANQKKVKNKWILILSISTAILLIAFAWMVYVYFKQKAISLKNILK